MCAQSLEVPPSLQLVFFLAVYNGSLDNLNLLVNCRLQAARSPDIIIPDSQYNGFWGWVRSQRGSSPGNGGGSDHYQDYNSYDVAEDRICGRHTAIIAISPCGDNCAKMSYYKKRTY
jgi:hypothetical protein